MDKTKVLLIEDDEILSELITKNLLHEGYEVKGVKNGKEGLNALEEGRPDLILLDIIMPEMNGYEFLEHLKTRTDIPPIIVVSNSGQPVEITRVLALGVKDYVIKVDFRPSELLEKIKKVLAENVPVTKKEEPPSGGEPDCVLIVEDDAFLRDLMSIQFTQHSYCVMHAVTGEEANEKMSTLTPRLVILDLLLPGVNGIEVLKNLKTNERTKNIPVLVVSNFNGSEYLTQIKEHGADGYLLKAEASPEKIYETALSLMK